jgi:hypothetical protein
MSQKIFTATTVTKVEFTHENLVDLFSTAELYSARYFPAWVPKKFSDLKDKGEGDCFEDSLVNVLANGGYICIGDMEEAEEGLTIEDARKHKNSKVLEVEELDDYECDNWIGACLVYKLPTYHITLARIKTAFEEIISGATTCDKETTECLQRNYREIFIDENGDFYDAWNIVQYIVFGDIIYG